MPAGPDLIDRVYSTLHPSIASTPAHIATRLKERGHRVPTLRAIRYAVAALVADGRARAERGKLGSAGTKVWAIHEMSRVSQPSPEMQANA